MSDVSTKDNAKEDKILVSLSEEEVNEILSKPKLYMDFEEAKKLRTESGWKGKTFLFLNEIGNTFRLYSKFNTIAITDFFRENFEKCFVEDNVNKTIENLKKEVWKRENERELFTRIIKDYYIILKSYYDYFFKLSSRESRVLLPKIKRNYRKIPLDQRKRIKYEHILVKRNFGKYEIDFFVKRNKKLLKKITLRDVCKWVDYIMLWGTYFGYLGESYLMNFLKREISEIEWRWSTEEEDKKGIDIVGRYKDVEIKIQVKLTRGGKIGEKSVDYSEVITIFVNINGEVYIAPKGLGEIGWKGFFKEIIKKIADKQS